MVTNLLKRYPELLEIMHLDERDRTISLRRIFSRDIEDNQEFKFRSKQIRPIKIEGKVNMDNLFNHLIKEEIEIVESSGNKYKKRIFEKDRSMRLHWLKEHIDETILDTIEVFSIVERDTRKRKDVKKTYLYNIKEKYVIVLEVQRSGLDYYLLSAHYLNKKHGQKEMNKKVKKKLQDVL
ncbi:MAG: hypothetical protein ISS16_07560 [Ignavibacteria bacterium]|nr:hypothetical protein [Bacteroidota bacterium]MBL7128825.1 hypothetical protein [Ignavibacteria bacterium]